MSKNFRHLQHTQRARIEHDLTLTRGAQQIIRDINVLSRGLFYGLSGKDAVVVEGLVSSPGSGLSVDLSVPAVAIQNIGGGDVSAVLDGNSGSAYNVVLEAADPTNPRLDIIEARVNRRSEFTDVAVDVVDPVLEVITPQTRDRDYEVYLQLQRRTGTPAPSPVPPTPTAATAGILLGTVAISGTIDLSTHYILNLSIGIDGEFVAVNCQGTTPAATTLVEILAAINAAGFGVIADNDGSDHVRITAPGTGENSVVKIKQPLVPTQDGYNTILGGVEDMGYYDEFIGANAWFKIAEIQVLAGATSLTATNVHSIEEKDTEWAAGASAIVLGKSLEGHRDSSPMDHVAGSVEDYHLAASAIAAINSKLTKYRGPYSIIYRVSGDVTLRRGRVNIGDVECVTETKLSQVLSAQEQQYPVKRVDQAQYNFSGNYTVLSSLSEAAADKITFSPDDTLLFAENHARAAVYVKTVGTGYTHIRIDLHDAANNQLATQQIAIANLTASDWNYVDLVSTLDPLATYHYHVYMVGFTGGASPTCGDDGGGNIAFKEMYLPTAGKMGGAGTADIIHVLDSTGSDIVSTRASGFDDLAYQGDVKGDKSLFTRDYMAVDFTVTDWATWSYGDYIGVDLATGRIKLPSPLSVLDYYAAFNTNEPLDDLDAKNILRHGVTQSVEDKLLLLEAGDAYIIRSGGAVDGNCHFTNIPPILEANRTYIVMDGTYEITSDIVFQTGAKLRALHPKQVFVHDGNNGYRFIMEGTPNGSNPGVISTGGATTDAIAGSGTNFLVADEGKFLYLSYGNYDARIVGKIKTVGSTTALTLESKKGSDVLPAQTGYVIAEVLEDVELSGIVWLKTAGTAPTRLSGVVSVKYCIGHKLDIEIVGERFDRASFANKAVAMYFNDSGKTDITLKSCSVSGSNQGVVHIFNENMGSVRIRVDECFMESGDAASDQVVYVDSCFATKVLILENSTNFIDGSTFPTKAFWMNLLYDCEVSIISRDCSTHTVLIKNSYRSKFDVEASKPFAGSVTAADHTIHLRTAFSGMNGCEVNAEYQYMYIVNTNSYVEVIGGNSSKYSFQFKSITIIPSINFFRVGSSAVEVSADIKALFNNVTISNAGVQLSGIYGIGMKGGKFLVIADTLSLPAHTNDIFAYSVVKGGSIEHILYNVQYQAGATSFPTGRLIYYSSSCNGVKIKDNIHYLRMNNNINTAAASQRFVFQGINCIHELSVDDFVVDWNFTGIISGTHYPMVYRNSGVGGIDIVTISGFVLNAANLQCPGGGLQIVGATIYDTGSSRMVKQYNLYGCSYNTKITGNQGVYGLAYYSTNIFGDDVRMNLSQLSMTNGYSDYGYTISGLFYREENNCSYGSNLIVLNALVFTNLTNPNLLYSSKSNTIFHGCNMYGSTVYIGGTGSIYNTVYTNKA